MPDGNSPIPKPSQVDTAVTWAVSRLTGRVQHPWRDAQLLLCSVLDVDLARLLAHPDQTLSASETSTFVEHVEKRTAGVPVQYILGVQEFFGRPFRVSPAVLIPRPETELLVEATIKCLRELESPRILEVGTGSGCVAVTLALELPRAAIVATEISEEAVLLAQENARELGAGGRIRLERADVWPGHAELFDVIVSNPPYVAEGSTEIMAEVSDFEPHLALFAADSGLAFFRRLFQGAESWLRPSGNLLVEIGYDQKDVVSGLSAGHGWSLCEAFQDLAGKDRVLAFRTVGVTGTK